MKIVVLVGFSNYVFTQIQSMYVDEYFSVYRVEILSKTNKHLLMPIKYFGVEVKMEMKSLEPTASPSLYLFRQYISMHSAT